MEREGGGCRGVAGAGVAEGGDLGGDDFYGKSIRPYGSRQSVGLSDSTCNIERP